MTRVKRDRSERAFLYFVLVIIIGLILMVFYDIPKLVNICSLFFLLGLMLLRFAHLTGRPEGNLDVICKIEKEE